MHVTGWQDADRLRTGTTVHLTVAARRDPETGHGRIRQCGSRTLWRARTFAACRGEDLVDAAVPTVAARAGPVNEPALL
ncbi:hypothetical protein GCM10009661_31160 [Catellatospora chokoriensis]